ncbi:hypothetical protein SCLCIDRAFT_709499 [Scleroderma citrinum Foug A]|uniref:Uncharacterized protein n=1 Tax=Scleroderma citrinum Foug A TaxID=1036808 RepID=A0A0C3A769_9AGAM|nr:hypothetical protein SCLCIDRAFT_709499 [Scleroderma citrinum Foug A]
MEKGLTPFYRRGFHSISGTYTHRRGIIDVKPERHAPGLRDWLAVALEFAQLSSFTADAPSWIGSDHILIHITYIRA